MLCLGARESPSSGSRNASSRSVPRISGAQERQYEATLQASELVRDESFDAVLGSDVAGELSGWRVSARYETLEPEAFASARWRHRPEERTLDLCGRRYGEGRPLVVAISASTISAGEGFAYALKAEKRAVIVGETSAGAANPGVRSRSRMDSSLWCPRDKLCIPSPARAGKLSVSSAHRSALEAVRIACDESRRRVVEDALKALSS